MERETIHDILDMLFVLAIVVKITIDFFLMQSGVLSFESAIYQLGMMIVLLLIIILGKLL